MHLSKLPTEEPEGLGWKIRLSKAVERSEDARVVAVRANHSAIDELTRAAPASLSAVHCHVGAPRQPPLSSARPTPASFSDIPIPVAVGVVELADSNLRGLFRGSTGGTIHVPQKLSISAY